MGAHTNREGTIRFLIGFALILGVFAISQPWISERFILWWWGEPHVWGGNQYWSFQVVMEYGHTQSYFLLNGFWVSASEKYSGHSGIYYGWIAVFFSQVLTIILGTVYVFKPKISGRSWHMDGTFSFSILSLMATLYQRFVQLEIQSAASYEYLSVYFSLGFWVAVASTLIILVSYGITRKEELENIFYSLRRRWKKTILITVALCLVFFFFMNEFQSQTDVTKWLIVAKKIEKYPSDPKLWENDFNTITTIATIFRGKILYNQPSYAFCEIAVPIISFQVLLSVYKSMGYEAYQSIPMHLL